MARKELLWSAASLAKALDVPELLLADMVACDELPRPQMVGGKIRWRVDEIEAWLSACTPALERNINWELERLYQKMGRCERETPVVCKDTNDKETTDQSQKT